MKVLHVISGGDSGGAKTSVIKLLKELADIGVTVKLICFIKGDFYQEVTRQGIDCELIPQKSRFDLSVLKRLSYIIQNDGYDLINAHGARANFILALIKKRIKVPLITTVHSDYKHDFDHHQLKRIVFTFLNAYSLKKMTAYITMAEDFRNIMVDRGFDKNKIHVAYNGVNEDRITSESTPEVFFGQYGVVYDPAYTYIGIASRLHPVKGVDVFLRGAKAAIAVNPNLRFVIAGFGDDKYEQMYKTYVIENNLVNVIYFIGFVENIYDFYNCIDVNVNSSHTEAVCYALLEGSMFKKPTIASRVGGTVELIEDNIDGLLFDDNDSEMLSQHIVTLANDRALRVKLGNQLFEKVIQKFTTRAMGERYLQIYQLLERN
ncbi:MAG: glycosyltransferase family 4 protein [Vallitaleaceae bacterium]|nr:glycosyltransferase family 4 protein [Vallitaleaceae bacterium]